MIAYNKSRNRVVADKVARADTALSRMKGLLGRDSLGPGEGLWIEPCAMIHMFFMRFAIDVLFLDKDLRVLRVIEGLGPWRVSPWVWGARGVVELAAGSLKGSVSAGDRLEFR